MIKLKKALLTVWASGLAGLSVQAQQWTFGPHFNQDLSTRQTLTQFRVDGLSTVLGQNYDGNTFGGGLFARYDRSRWYGQAELNYLGSRVLSYYISAPNVGIGNGTPYARFDGRLMGGYKPLPWLRVSGGLGVVRHAVTISDKYQSYIEGLRREIASYPQNTNLIGELKGREIAQALENNVRPFGMEAYAGVGVDIGGLTVDLIHSNTLTSQLNDITLNGQVYPIRQHSSAWTLQLGYRLFPVKNYLLAPRRSNRAYERIKKEIPFYRNEVHVAVGMMSEKLGSRVVYENRYTRYFTRRLGLTAGLNLMRATSNLDASLLPQQVTQTQLITGLRVLPLYSRRHTIGITAGPIVTYASGFRVTSGRLNQPTGAWANLRNNSRLNGLSVNLYGMADYQVAATDRLVLGPWLRVTPDDATLGLSAGYRF